MTLTTRNSYSQLNCSISTADRVWIYSGATRCDARQRKNTLQWSMIVEHQMNVSQFMGSYKVLTETGGLLRVAVKLMMACASQNVDVFVTSRPIAR
jgi:hypothetical protein